MRAAVDHAALTEPMAVGLHSVRKAGVLPPDAPARDRLWARRRRGAD